MKLGIYWAHSCHRYTSEIFACTGLVYRCDTWPDKPENLLETAEMKVVFVRERKMWILLLVRGRRCFFKWLKLRRAAHCTRERQKIPCLISPCAVCKRFATIFFLSHLTDILFFSLKWKVLHSSQRHKSKYCDSNLPSCGFGIQPLSC